MNTDRNGLIRCVGNANIMGHVGGGKWSKCDDVRVRAQVVEGRAPQLLLVVVRGDVVDPQRRLSHVQIYPLVSDRVLRAVAFDLMRATVPDEIR